MTRSKNWIILTLVILLLPNYTNALTPESIKNTTTIVVLKNTKNPDTYSAKLNKTLKEILKKEWSFTKLTFLERSEFKKTNKKYLNNSNYSFISLLDIGETTNLVLSKGIRKNGKVSLPKYHLSIGYIIAGTDYRFNYDLEAQLTKDIQLIKHYLFSTSNYLNTINNYPNNTPQIPDSLKTLTLHVPETFINLKSFNKIQNKYSFNIKLTSINEISQAIKEKRKKFMYFDFHQVTKSYGRIILYNSNNGTPIYFSHLKTGYYNSSIGDYVTIYYSLQDILEKACKDINKLHNKETK